MNEAIMTIVAEGHVSSADYGWASLSAGLNVSLSRQLQPNGNGILKHNLYLNALLQKPTLTLQSPDEDQPVSRAFGPSNPTSASHGSGERHGSERHGRQRQDNPRETKTDCEEITRRRSGERCG